MLVKRTFGIFAALALMASVPAVSEASFASQIGSKYGGTLRSSTSTRTQQLTADPVTVLKGSTSTEYDPKVVSLKSITANDGFFITEAYVGVSFDGESEDLVSLNQFLNGLESPATQTGYLQVFYQRSEGSSSLMAAASSDGYTTVDQDGETAGDDTHTMLFDYLASNNTTIAKYRLYADDGSRGTSADTLTSIANPDIRIRDIQEANVAGSLIPLPAAFGPGLIGLAGVGIVHRLRRRVAA